MSAEFSVFGEADAKTLTQMEQCLAVEPEDAVGALMADNHLGYSMPIGGVVGYVDHISPSGVGFDIGCGNLYTETNIDAKDVDVGEAMIEVSKVISFGIGRPNAERIEDHEVFDAIRVMDLELKTQFLNKAKAQLGTVGAGNHYVDLFENRRTGKLGVGVHFGSRGFGHGLATKFMAIAAGVPEGERFSEGGMMAPPLVLKLGTPAAADYEYAMNVALEYANAGREWVVERIIKGILNYSGPIRAVHNNHNYAAREKHFVKFGESAIRERVFLMHRKGATPAFPGQEGFVGATMGEDAALVMGTHSQAAEFGALFSTVHGAGRQMSRMRAKKGLHDWRCRVFDDQPCPRQFSGDSVPKDQKCPVHRIALAKHQIEPPINFRNVQDELRDKGIVLIGGEADEAPAAYKRLDEVLEAHVELGAVKVTDRLKVLGVAMAGRDVYDPFKD